MIQSERMPNPSGMKPAANQPGTLRQQFAIINAYVDLPSVYKRRWPRASWRAVRQAIIDHARLPRREDLYASGGQR